jgi:anaerobic selenocysteine-containing dehydrogenase
MTKAHNIPTICRMCEQGCGMVVTVQNGRPIRVQGSKSHPYNKGWLCAKGRASLDFFYSAQRLTSPLIRKHGELKASSWEESLDFAAKKLQELKERYGPQSLAIYHGEGTGHQEIKYFMKRFANVFGTPNFSGVGSICNAARTLGEEITYGGVTKPDISNTRFMLVWGGNPLISHEPVLPRDIPGGDLFTPRPKIKDITMPLPSPPLKPLGSEEFPLFCKMRKEARALSIPDAILEERPYPIKGMIIAGGNTTLEWPDSERVRRALQKLDFLMVIDVVRSPDCEYARVVLPACTFLERDEHRVNVYLNLHHITLRRQVVEPLYGIPDQMIWIKLAQGMGFGEYFPWQTCGEAIDHLLSDLGSSYEKLISHGGICEYEKRKYKKYEARGFNTPSGKVEIISGRLGAEGYDPFPVGKGVLHPVENEEAYPLLLTTGGNLLPYLHWQYRYIPRLRKIAPEPLVEIHPASALRWGISDGEMACVQTAYGEIRMRAHVTPRIRPDTVHVPQGWDKANANELTSGKSPDPISGFPNLKSLRCRVHSDDFTRRSGRL